MAADQSLLKNIDQFLGVLRSFLTFPNLGLFIDFLMLGGCSSRKKDEAERNSPLHPTWNLFYHLNPVRQ